MVGHFDNAEIGIDCPNCGHHFEKSIGRLKREGDFPCPAGCGAVFETDQIAADVKAAEKQLADFQRTVGKLGKRR